MNGRGVYVHLPFCLSKCSYCTFNSCVRSEAHRRAYLKALLSEIASLPLLTADTVYFGGGTPTVYSPADLARVLRALDEALDIAPDAEVTLEANPENLDPSTLADLREAGFTRISIGVQSLDDAELAILGRVHDAKRAEHSVSQARNAGFHTVSIDLIRGLPGQRLHQWQDALNSAIALEPDHISVYGLSVEAGTPLSAQIESGQLPEPPSDDPLWVEWTADTLHRAGYRRYEISNYARPGNKCRHNLHYWYNNEYIGVGAGACSYRDGQRTRNIADYEEYASAIRNGGSVIAESERLSRYEALGETVMLGLRMVEGIGRQQIIRRFDIDPHQYYKGTIRKLIDAGLMADDPDCLRLTFQGLLVQSAVAVEFLADPDTIAAGGSAAARGSRRQTGGNV